MIKYKSIKNSTDVSYLLFQTAKLIQHYCVNSVAQKVIEHALNQFSTHMESDSFSQTQVSRKRKKAIIDSLTDLKIMAQNNTSQ